MSNILAEIVVNKKNEIALRKQSVPLAALKNNIQNSSRSLKQALSNSHSDFIFECKKASPSKGIIRQNFDKELDDILQQYSEYASAISVLTDKKYFQGDFSYLTRASLKVKQPILCKDFFVDEYQVYEARYHGADAILLMLSVLDDQQYLKLANIAKSLELDILTEIHDEIELKRAIALDAEIIGINNRNLKDLSIDLATTEKLAKLLPSEKIVISESGINNHQDIKRLAPKVSGFLIGSSIMEKTDIRSQCKALLYGTIKICGITRLEDAVDCDKNGAIYAGFIFHPKSKRFISLENAAYIAGHHKMPYVGVFVDAAIDNVIEHATQLSLHAVQLHGSESEEYIRKLKEKLPNIEIWKALAIANPESISIPQYKGNQIVDRYLLDCYSIKSEGGTGESFDWQLLDTIDTSELILAGGINSHNVIEAKTKNTFALDLSSGVEITPGIKSQRKIENIFSQLRA
jgi:indole-3-glycerol phosphate synthase/phosphoribosylanthranilate isomerase